MDSITQGFTSIIEFFTTILNYLNPFSDDFILNSIIDVLFDLLNYLNPFSDDFILSSTINILGDLLNYLNPFSEDFWVYKLIDLLSDLFVFLFVPDDDCFTQFSDLFDSKLSFVDDISEQFDSIYTMLFIEDDEIDNNQLTYYVETDYYTGNIVISFSWFEKFKPVTDLFLTGFIYIFFIWRLYKNLPNTIAGVSSGVETISSFQKRGE